MTFEEYRKGWIDRQVAEQKERAEFWVEVYCTTYEAAIERFKQSGDLVGTQAFERARSLAQNAANDAVLWYDRTNFCDGYKAATEPIRVIAKPSFWERMLGK